MHLRAWRARAGPGRRRAPRRRGRRRLVQAHQRQADGRLARARLADDAERLARGRRKVASFTAANLRLRRTGPRCGSRSSWSGPWPRRSIGAAGILRACARRCIAVRAAGHEVVDHRQARRPRGPGAAGRRAAPGCRRPAGRRRCRATGPCSRISPLRITTTWSAISPTTPRSWRDEQHRHLVLLLQRGRSARGSAAGS